MAPGDPPKDDQYAELNAARAAKMQRKLMVPLIYGPLLPLIRIGLRHNPPLRNKAYGVGILTALAHAGYIMSQDSSV